VYNLLVTADDGAWDNDDFVLDFSRYLEHTDAEIAQRLRALDGPVRAELMSLPTLFAYETPVGGDARVGWIRSIDRRQAEVRITFRFDATIAPVPPQRLAGMMWELEIGRSEMSRTHWAVKTADLLAVLSGAQADRSAPEVPPYATVVAVHPGTPKRSNQKLTQVGDAGLDDYLPSTLRERFRCVDHISDGSYASVYLVVERESLRRWAVKLTRTTPEAEKRALREVEAMRRLRHEAILVAADFDPDGRWFVLPLAEGTLGQFKAWDLLADGSAIEVAHTVGSALVYAHDQGFVHRDLHVDNILRHDGRWRVADWGLTVARDHQRLTRTRSAGGNETWIAPEQFRRLKDADERSDLFSSADSSSGWRRDGFRIQPSRETYPRPTLSRRL
jgi:hypothetical protein